MFEKRQDACAPPAVEGSEDIVREGDAPEDVRSTTPAIPGGVMDAERGPSEPLAPEYSNPQHPPQASRANRRGEEALRRLSEKQQGKNLNTASGNEPNFENTAQDDGSSGAGGGTTGTNNSHQATNANRAVSRSPPRPVQDHMPAANPGTTTTTNNFNLTIHGNLTYAPQDNRSTNINVSWPRGPMHQHEQQHPSRSQAPPRWHDPFGPHEQAQDRDGQRQSGRHRSGQPQPTQQSAYGQPFTFPCRGRRRPAGTTEMPGQPSGASAAHHRGSGANENGFVEDDYFNGAADCESGSQEHDTDMGEPSV